MRKIKAFHKAIYEPIADLQTWRPMPTAGIQHLDPFLFLNHHGPQNYGPNNNGLPFGPHPHRGFETLTIILQGDITHKDSFSGESVINAGGIQWMTAGKGLIHSEVSSEEFKKNGGMEEVIQLWFNLPAKFKMVDPNYQGFQQDSIEHITLDGGSVLHLFSGEYNGQKGPAKSITNLFTSTIDLEKGSELTLEVPGNHQILFYVINGEIEINGEEARKHELVEFYNGEGNLHLKGSEKSQIIFCHGEAYNEPIVAHGPFVMNSQKEIYEAFEDYQAGKLGSMS